MGQVVQLDTTFAPGKYNLYCPNAGDETDPQVVLKESPALLVKGTGITVDFTKVELIGSPARTAPDQRHGIAVKVQGNNITLIGLRAKGYKIALIADHCRGLKLINCDLSDNWKTHLLSTPEKENEADWQFYHHNENHEWLRYGAGIYLDGCQNFLVKGCNVLRGQCGLMINQGTGGTVINNNFSFDSGLGIGMYRSSLNRITNNKMDWDARGYSWNNYYRGQDSSSILMFEQCNRNLVAYNSMTEGGDGVFLWAGFHTMDTGDGGCNDNVFAFNDVSSAIANGLEATFSRNAFIGNLALECWHGLWGGYSFDSLVEGNTFGFSINGIAWEHGTYNTIVGNTFVGCQRAIDLWADPPSGLSDAYLKARPSPSQKIRVDNNHFAFCTSQPVRIRNTRDFEASGNTVSDASASLDNWIEADAKSQPITQSNNQFMHSDLAPQTPAIANYLAGAIEYTGDVAAEVTSLKWDPIRNPNPDLTVTGPIDAKQRVTPPVGGVDPFLGGYRYRGRRYLMIGQWGPYDFERPIFMNLGRDAKSGSYRFESLGPRGRFVIKSVTGGDVVSPAYGVIGNVVEVRPSPGPFVHVEVNAQFTGEASRDEYGNAVSAGTPVAFRAIATGSQIPWKAYYYLYGPDSDPIAQPEGFAKLLAAPPVAVQSLNQLDFIKDGDWAKGVRGDHYAIEALSKVYLNAGTYHVELTVDDGGELFVDGHLVPLLGSDGKVGNPFRYQGATTYHADLNLRQGNHELKVIYFQIDGGRTLQFTIAKGPGSR